MRLLFILTALAGIFVATPPIFAQSNDDAQKKQALKKSLAPYVSSPMNVVERMLELCEVGANKVVYDLGCGDGRILVSAAKTYKARAVGVELSPKWAQLATDKVVEAGVQHRVRVLQQDMLEADLAEADIVTLYLISEANTLLRPKLEKELRPGACVVSHDFEIKGWKPASVETIKVFQRPHMLYVYKVGVRR
ncbi:MAG: class I SAM-dependent methyltransferase [Bryobacterales bacterium]|jgi:SAM-dependent methyltransferase|nr:class I SAM-dependent methyltransferase [Bryobacterales bacterium]